MFFESCLASEHVFMCAYPVEMHFMCTNSTLFLDFHLYVAFYKFELDILWELSVAPTQLHLNAWATICAFRVLCNEVFITTNTLKFIHHNKSEGKHKGSGVSLTCISCRAVITLYTTSYKNFKGHFFRFTLVPSLCPFTLLGRELLISLFIGLLHPTKTLLNMFHTCLLPTKRICTL